MGRRRGPLRGRRAKEHPKSGKPPEDWWLLRQRIVSGTESLELGRRISAAAVGMSVFRLAGSGAECGGAAKSVHAVVPGVLRRLRRRRGREGWRGGRGELGL